MSAPVHAGAGERDDALSPAARKIISGAWFSHDHEVEWVERRATPGPNPLADLLTIGRFGNEHDAMHTSEVVITVRLLERRIAAGRIHMVFHGWAHEFNEHRGWDPPRGSRPGKSRTRAS